MNASSPAEVIADAIAGRIGTTSSIGDISADVMTQLSERGYCIVELPKPDSHGRWRSERWGVRDDGWLKWSVGLSEDGTTPFASARRASGPAPSSAVAEHRAFAAAILAACDGSY